MRRRSSGSPPRSFRTPTTDLRLRFQVAAKLGMTVDDLDERMPPGQLAMWAAFIAVENEERKRGR